MLDLKKIRENPDGVLEKLRKRGQEYSLEAILELDKKQREIEKKRIELQARGNEIGKIIGQKIRGGANPQSEEILKLKQEGNDIKAVLAELEPQERELKAQIEALLLELPNLPCDTTPVGKDEKDNVEVRRWGDEYIPDNPNLLSHEEIGEKLGIIDVQRAVKIAQSRFVALIGPERGCPRKGSYQLYVRPTNPSWLQGNPTSLLSKFCHPTGNRTTAKVCR